MLLYLLEGNVLAIQSLDEILDSINDFQRPGFLPLSHIPRLEPSIRGKRFIRLLFIVVVSPRKRRSTKPDFTLRWGVGV